MVLTVGIISDLIRGDVFQWGKIMAALRAGLAAADPDLRLPDGLLRGRPDRRRDQGLSLNRKPRGNDKTMAEVSCRKVVKNYDGGVQAVKGIDLEIADQEFVVLVGPSAAASRPRCA